MPDLTSDQVTAIAPDAASLKAGRGLAAARHWQLLGSDAEALWGLASGSGKEPYQTRVALADLATKCSCPSRKFPCKHALGLMFLATGPAGSVPAGERPPWVAEWLDARADRTRKAAERRDDPAGPVDEAAAEKRREKRLDRVGDGVSMVRQALLDLAREGMAASTARAGETWEGLARRMVDAQAPGIAGRLRYISDTVLREPDVDIELPLALGHLHLLLTAWTGMERLDETTRAELLAQAGGRNTDKPESAPGVADEWFVAGRRVEERDRLITSSTWLFGLRTGRWARVLRFAPVPQTIVEPWAVGTTARDTLSFEPGLYPLRAAPSAGGTSALAGIPDGIGEDLEALLGRFASALAANPFLRVLPFLAPVMPAATGGLLVDPAGNSLPWQAGEDLALQLDCICGGRPALACGEWDGRHLRLLAIRDGGAWIPLVSTPS